MEDGTSYDRALLLESLDAALEALDVGVVRHAPQGPIIAANPAAARLLGLSLDQLLGRDSFDPRWRAVGEDGQVMPGDRHPAMVALATGQPVVDGTLGIEVPDVGLRWLSVSAFPIPGSGEGPAGVTAVFRDVTAMTRGDHALRTWEQRYRLAAELAPVGIAILSLDGVIIRANRAFTELFEREESLLQRQPWYQVLPVRDSLAMRPLVADLRSGARNQLTVEVQLDTDPVKHARVHVGIVTIPEQPYEFVAVAEDVTAEVARRDVLERRADHDPLTGLLNLQALLRRAPLGPGAGPTAAIFVDVDYFKAVNDEHGHAAGDTVLVTIARRLLEQVRTGDLVARAGGDEFVIILPGIDAATASTVADRIVTAARKPISSVGGPVPATVSVGLAVTRGGAPVEDLLRRADRAMYAAKGEGRDRLTVDPDAS